MKERLINLFFYFSPRLSSSDSELDNRVGGLYTSNIESRWYTIMENNKKILVPTIIAVATLVLLVVGATYAYFTTTSTNRFGTKELNASLEDMADAVVLEQLENELSLNVTRAMMSEDNAWNVYFASGNYVPANIAKISVTGDGTYKCDYKITVTKSASSIENDLYETFKNKSEYGTEILFYLDNVVYDLGYEENLFPLTYESTMYNITNENPKYITSNLGIENTDYEQNFIKGKDITLTYSISDFECELSEPTGEYTELAFTGDYQDDIGYGQIFGNEDIWYLSSNNYIIPETFQGKDGVWYKVVAIESYTNDAWHGIENIELPESVLSIYNEAFIMSTFETIKLPKQLVSIGEDVFGASSLKNIYIPKSLENVGYKFLSDAPIENIYYEGTEAEWNALFSEYVGEGKEYNTIFEYIGYFDNNPTMHFNVNY